MSDRNPARELADSGTPLPWRLTDSETVNDVWQAGLTVVGVDSDAIANVADEWYEPEGQDEDATPWNDAAKIVRAVNALPAIADLLDAIANMPLMAYPELHADDCDGHGCTHPIADLFNAVHTARDAVEAALRGDA